MPIAGIEQPELLPVDVGLRLRKFDGETGCAFQWYQDTEMVYMVDGVHAPYTREKLQCMYAYLNHVGELYWIEAEDKGAWRPIGDVTFWKDDMPIVIGDRAMRGQGIGRRVIAALAERARSLGWQQLRVGEIYDWNEPSRRCFESVGFTAMEKTDKGRSYMLKL